MRAFGRMILFVAFATLLAGMVGGQQPFKGGFGKGKGINDYFSLVNNFQVRGEIKLTEEQAAKLPDAALKALREVLDAGQLKRLREIHLRQNGNAAYLDPDVKKELKITDEQAKKIQEAIALEAKERLEMFQSGNFDLDRNQELTNATTAKVQGILTDAQKTAWTRMIGEPFEMKGFGFGFGKKKD